MQSWNAFILHVNVSHRTGLWTSQIVAPRNTFQCYTHAHLFLLQNAVNSQSSLWCLYESKIIWTVPKETQCPSSQDGLKTMKEPVRQKHNSLIETPTRLGLHSVFEPLLVLSYAYFRSELDEYSSRRRGHYWEEKSVQGQTYSVNRRYRTCDVSQYCTWRWSKKFMSTTRSYLKRSRESQSTKITELNLMAASLLYECKNQTTWSYRQLSSVIGSVISERKLPHLSTLQRYAWCNLISEHFVTKSILKIALNFENLYLVDANNLECLQIYLSEEFKTYRTYLLWR